jgi:hypothetical protein
LKELINKVEPLEKDWLDALLVVIPMTVNDFHKTFFSDNAPFGPDVFCKK